MQALSNEIARTTSSAMEGLNMLSVLMKFALVLTTIAPIGLTLSFLLYQSSHETIWSIIVLFLSLSLCAICHQIIIFSAKKLNKTTIAAASLKPADKEISGYFVAYMLPILGGGKYFLDPATFAFFSFMFFIFIWVSKSFYANPVLAVFGYKFYEIQLTNGANLLLITKRNINKPADIGKINYITSHTVLDAS
ncbi:hypothetical protein C4K09_5014 [Pseudomonas chlororaphis subsp. aureofaciens]|uniref:hypothetical protein n=1 Tax=Pseudomonas chlororaphis TaxID=587753 RepID=UPI000F6F9885|nr:hypothetical protein C4K09_5014 [Pseudomonas chlororaphis subsp. aureofaciens]